jgi:hypothetical protein
MTRRMHPEILPKRAPAPLPLRAVDRRRSPITPRVAAPCAQA